MGADQEAVMALHTAFQLVGPAQQILAENEAEVGAKGGMGWVGGWVSEDWGRGAGAC